MLQCQRKMLAAGLQEMTGLSFLLTPIGRRHNRAINRDAKQLNVVDGPLPVLGFV